MYQFVLRWRDCIVKILYLNQLTWNVFYSTHVSIYYRKVSKLKLDCWSSFYFILNCWHQRVFSCWTLIGFFSSLFCHLFLIIRLICFIYSSWPMLFFFSQLLSVLSTWADRYTYCCDKKICIQLKCSVHMAVSVHLSQSERVQYSVHCFSTDFAAFSQPNTCSN